MESPTFHMLIVEDDPHVRQSLQVFFENEGFDVRVAVDGEEGLQNLQKQPDLDIVLLDIMLPKMNGFDVLRTLQAQHIEVPVLMLTARGELEHRLASFELGVEDYLMKPFSARELSARVTSILRRRKLPCDSPMDVWRFGDVEVNFSTHHVYRGADEVQLTAFEYNLLRYLIQHRGAAVSRRELLEKVWNIPGDIVTRTIDRHVASLRRKLERDPGHPVHIETVYGQGYCFRE